MISIFRLFRQTHIYKSQPGILSLREPDLLEKQLCTANVKLYYQILTLIFYEKNNNNIYYGHNRNAYVELEFIFRYNAVSRDKKELKFFVSIFRTTDTTLAYEFCTFAQQTTNVGYTW